MGRSNRLAAKRKCEGEERPFVSEKRIARPEDCEVNKEEETETDPLAQFNINDHFSRINDDCTLKILKLLAKNDLYSVARTSKNFFKMCTDKSLKLPEVPWEARLIIFPTSSGYGFRIIPASKHERRRAPLDVYTFDGGMYLGCTTPRWTKKYAKTAEIVSCETKGVNLRDIPQYFYSRLDYILEQEKYVITSLSIRKMRFENRLFAKLHEVLNFETINKIECINMPCEHTKEIMQKTRKSFADLTFQSRIIDLSRLSPNASYVIDEDLIQMMSYDQCELRTNYSADVPHMNCFRPTRGYIYFLLRFSIFDVVTMIVGGARIVDRIEEFLKKRSLPEGRPVFWRFSVENVDAIFLPNLSLYVFPLKGRRYKDRHDGMIYEIECKKTGKMARIYRETKQQKYVGEEGDIKVVTVIFFGREYRNRVRSNCLTYLPLRKLRSSEVKLA